MTTNRIVVAGAAGDLGDRIVRALVARGADVQALLRVGSDPAKVERVQHAGAAAVVVDFADRASLARACGGAGCVVSALSGLGDVIVETQGRLLDARDRGRRAALHPVRFLARLHRAAGGVEP